MQRTHSLTFRTGFPVSPNPTISSSDSLEHAQKYTWAHLWQSINGVSPMSWLTASLAVTAWEQEQERDDAMCGSSVPVFWRRVLRNDDAFASLASDFPGRMCSQKTSASPGNQESINSRHWWPDILCPGCFIHTCYHLLCQGKWRQYHLQAVCSTVAMRKGEDNC